MAETIPPTDAELDGWIRARLATIGIDLGQLPVADSTAPADQTRVLSSLRNFLRGTVPVISDFAIEVQEVPPAMYPAEYSVWTKG